MQEACIYAAKLHSTCMHKNTLFSWITKNQNNKLTLLTLHHIKTWARIFTNKSSTIFIEPSF